MSAVLSLRVLVPPTFRGDCAEGTRPCPWKTCRYHLHADVLRVSAANLARRRTSAGEETCALDVAERGELRSAEIGRVMGLSRQRVQQLEASGTRQLVDALEELKPEGHGVMRAKALQSADELHLGENPDIEAMRTARASTDDDDFADRMWRAYLRGSR